jgi:NADH-quinone oxidoreductase subunit N
MVSDVSTIHAPSVSYHAIAPILIILGAAMLGVLAEALVPRAERYAAQLMITLGGLIAAMITVVMLHGKNETTLSGAVAIDGTGLFLQGTILLLAIMSVLLVAERSVDVGSPIVASAALIVGSAGDRRQATTQRIQTEVFPMLLFAVSGMLIFPVSNNLLLMFVALEVLSLPLYLMAGLSRRRRLLSQEAALKYFLLGAFASAFFLYGLALLYGYANSVDLPAIRKATQGFPVGVATGVSPKSDVLLYAGLALLLVGLLFKAGIAPFHSWTPDVYQGSPTPITAFMASCTKVAAFGAILRVLYVGFDATAWNWRPIIWAVAIASMAVGAIFGLTQTDIKRVLAYSSIAHAGFLMVAMVSLTKDGVASILFYLLTYGFSTLAAFGLLMLVRDADGEATHLSQWSGLARKSPIVATVMTVLLMSMAGIPLTAGFIGKFYVFRSAYHVAAPLVVLALLFSAIAAFYYLRIVVLMFFAEAPEHGPTIAIPGWSTTVALTFGVMVTIILGIIPQPVLDWAARAAKLVG